WPPLVVKIPEQKTTKRCTNATKTAQATAIANARTPDKISGPKTRRKKTPKQTRIGKLLPPSEPRNLLAD
ncbi:MAG: hypothetical protein VX126_00280, partial [Planctomycetota bacterium]|nr:hypothetical protein [Planctomycetota bacterium]